MKTFMLLILCSMIFSFVLSSEMIKASEEKPKKMITAEIIAKVIAELEQKFGAGNLERIKQGVAQAAFFWRSQDGTEKEFEEFCRENFIPDTPTRKLLFSRLEKNFETVIGNFLKVSRTLREPFDLEIGEKLVIDDLFAKFSPSDHFVDDLFTMKIAFSILLNFPQTDLEAKLKDGPNWSRNRWAEAKLTDMLVARVPSELNQAVNEVAVKSDGYINDYNIYVGRLLTEDKKTLFPEDLKLISHWGLRDEIKAQYKNSDGLAKQNLIYNAMLKIIDGSIPKNVINKNENYWDPVKNILYEKKGNTFQELKFESENLTRYEHYLKGFQVQKAIDPYYPTASTFIKRKFNLERQLPEEEVEKLFISILSSDQAKKVGQLISKRLGRKLMPFDVWYEGFKPAQPISETELDKIVRVKYPSAEAFQIDIPNILEKLGFEKDQAKFISERVVVDSARGAGHAMGAQMKDDKAHLRTRIPADGMNYQSFNVAMHELGHTVEQTFSLYKVDNFFLNGVPNTAFTECFAFVFQAKDMDMLGYKIHDEKTDDMIALNDFWMTYEIAGVALIDMKMWRWLYANPEATPAQMKEAEIKISKEIWNEYFAPVFDIKDITLLGIYSHALTNPLYLPDYPIGHLVCFQINSYLKDKKLGPEMEKMCVLGCVTPKLWMEKAMGVELSTKPMLDAVKLALDHVK
ncbi:MAG: hypothetical protein HQM08_09380 [Candidatus Riflebacteria bacterium]|nr:hypothetical protein [Candidatus Riflebacteria bacterium]